MKNVLLEISDLSVFVGSLRIIDGISLSIGSGESVGLIGPNGSGKTTLFNATNGFMPTTTGKIFFKGEDLSKAPAHYRAKSGMARVFQNSGIFRDMTLEENLLLALEAKSSVLDPRFSWSSSYKKNLKEARYFLSEIGLEEKLKNKAASLSGGQLRLLEIVRALAFGADLFLLDEPTAGVSPRMKEDVVSLVKKLKDKGKTILIIEHDINLIESFCDRILVMDAGKIVMDGNPKEIRSSSKLQEIYFGKSGEYDAR
jgi:ABC-type branched-subunit amino acid transport system ATPase component